MKASEKERRRVAGWLILLSALGWMMLLIVPEDEAGLSFCRVMGTEWSWPSFRALLAISPITSLAVDWMLMLIAMMTPTLIAPVFHVHQRSFNHRRVRSVALFAIGYGAVWMSAGVVLLTVQLMLSVSAPHSIWPAAVAGLFALVWQCSPLKQLCLNRSHNHSQLAAFGVAADRDALGFGFRHGVWCIGSCWALMLLPMLLVQGHTISMVAVMIVMISERLESPNALRWRLRGPGKLMRMLVAQTRLMCSPSQKRIHTTLATMASDGA